MCYLHNFLPFSTSTWSAGLDHFGELSHAHQLQTLHLSFAGNGLSVPCLRPLLSAIRSLEFLKALVLVANDNLLGPSLAPLTDLRQAPRLHTVTLGLTCCSLDAAAVCAIAALGRCRSLHRLALHMEVCSMVLDVCRWPCSCRFQAAG